MTAVLILRMFFENPFPPAGILRTVRFDYFRVISHCIALARASGGRFGNMSELRTAKMGAKSVQETLDPRQRRANVNSLGIFLNES